MREHSKTFATGMRPVRQRLGAIACALVSVLLAAFMAGCSAGSTPAATVSTFTATSGSSSGSAITITSGASVTLSWSVANATTVAINGTAVSGSSITVSPTTTTIYNLVATNSKGQSVTASVTVTVNAAAAISSFTVTYNGTPSTSATAITSGYSGESATLTWKTTGATTVTLNGGTPTTATNSSITVTPSQTTVYTLIATNAAGTSTSKTVTVNVEAAPSIGSFTTSPTTITYGGSFNFSASNYVNCDSLTVSPAIGGNSNLLSILTAIHPINVAVTADTTYTATCTDLAGDSATLQTLVKVLPAVTLSAASTNVTIGGDSSTTLNWSTQGSATSVELYSYPTISGVSAATILASDLSGGGTLSSGSYSITPTASTSYYLVANSNDGSTDSGTVKVTVSSAITDITSFLGYQSESAAATGTTAVASTSSTGTVYLVPIFANGNSGSNATDTATIVDSNGNTITNSAISGTAYPVSPGATTTYTLTVTNSSYSPSRDEVMTLRVIVGNISIFEGEGVKVNATTSIFTPGAYNTSIVGTPGPLAAIPGGTGFYVIDSKACVVGALGTDGSLLLEAGVTNKCQTNLIGSEVGYYSALPVTGSATWLGETLGGLAADSSGNLFIALSDDGNNDAGAVYKVSNGSLIEIAGNANLQDDDTDGQGSAASFANYAIQDIAIDSKGEAIVAETNAIRVIDSTNTVTTIAGSTSSTALTDGVGKKTTTGTQASFKAVVGIAMDTSTDTIYIVDTYSIRKMVPDKTNDTSTCHAACWNWTVTTLNSGAKNGSGHVDGPLTTAKFVLPIKITRASDGTLFVTDGSSMNAKYYGYIRRIATNGQVDTIAGDGVACSTTPGSVLGTLPNSTNLNAAALPDHICAFGYNGSAAIIVDPANQRLLFDTGDNTSIYTMPY